MITLLIFLFILGLLILVHEFGHFIIAKKNGVRVEEFFLGFGPNIWSKKIKDTLYGFKAIALGGYVKLAGDSEEAFKGKPDEYLSKTPGQRAAIIFFGPLLNYVLGILFFWLIFVIGYPTLTTKVGGLVDGLGAQAAGIRPGDKITAIDSDKVNYWEDLQKIIQRKKDKAMVKVALLRDGKPLDLEVDLRFKEFSDTLGRKQSVPVLGITPDDEIVKVNHGILESCVLGLNKTWELTVMTYTGLWRMITGKISVRESVTGPLGIFYITSKAASLGFVALLHLVAVLSISLAIFNLLPLPVLDGGHILFLCLEKIRGRRLKAKTETIITNTGVTLMIMLAVFVTYNDLMRLFGDKLAKFFK